MNCRGCEERREKLKYFIDKILSVVPDFNVSDLRLGQAKRIIRQLVLTQGSESTIISNKAAQDQKDGEKS